MRVLRCFGILCMGLAVVAAGAALSGCCECPVYFAAVARVRLLNWSEPPVPVYFHFYRHGEPQVPEDALASGSFVADGDTNEAYATKDGEIFIFYQGSGGGGYDVHVFVDMDGGGVLTAGDMERLVTVASMEGDYVVEVDYPDFTTVD